MICARHCIAMFILPYHLLLGVGLHYKLLKIRWHRIHDMQQILFYALASVAYYYLN